MESNKVHLLLKYCTQVLGLYTTQRETFYLLVHNYWTVKYTVVTSYLADVIRLYSMMQCY